MRFAPYFLGLCATLASLACSSGSSTVTTIVRPQLVGVDPDDFLGAVRCVGSGGQGGDGGEGNAVVVGPGEIRSYVATLTDVTRNGSAGTSGYLVSGGLDADGKDTPFQLASSLPTTCLDPVTFSYVVTNHSYTAHVDAYTEAPQELTPFALGSALMLSASGARLTPKWTANCGGYPPSPGGGAGGTSGAAGAPAGGAGGTGGASELGGFGVVAYDTLTQTPHDCGSGLQPVP